MVHDLKKLSLIAQSQPHACYATYCHGLFVGTGIVCSYVYLMILLAQFAGFAVPGTLKQRLHSLLAHLGGLGLFDPNVFAAQQYFLPHEQCQQISME